MKTIDYTLEDLFEYYKAIYIDADGVIWDTETHLFDEYHAKKNAGIKVDKWEYLSNYDWYNKIYEAGMIEGSIEFLREHPEAIVLTKCVTIDNEANAKRKVLKELGCSNEVLIVPVEKKKTDIVDAKDAILVDDTVHNLVHFDEHGGKPIYFNHRNCDIDPWDNTNESYIKINNLKTISKYLHR